MMYICHYYIENRIFYRLRKNVIFKFIYVGIHRHRHTKLLLPLHKNAPTRTIDTINNNKILKNEFFVKIIRFYVYHHVIFQQNNVILILPAPG